MRLMAFHKRLSNYSIKEGEFMSKITDYGFLFQQMFGTKGTKSTSAIGSFQLSQLNSSSIQSQLKAAGIDTNSAQYKAAIKQMMSNANGSMYTNIQSIKNLMKSYDKDGDYIDPTTGLAGLLLTDENASSQKRIISIPESSKDEMFEQTKKEFLQENGVLNGDTTKRSDVYTNMYRKVQKNDRLAAGYTMQQYERAYRQAFISAAKAADPGWEIGKPVSSGTLDGITRESVEANLKKSGSSLHRCQWIQGYSKLVLCGIYFTNYFKLGNCETRDARSQSRTKRGRIRAEHEF